MSPDVKTASRYCHIAWTAVHCSRISETHELVDPLVGEVLEGTTKRDASIGQVHHRLLDLHHLRRRAHVERDVAARPDGTKEVAHDPVVGDVVELALDGELLDGERDLLDVLRALEEPASRSVAA